MRKFRCYFSPNKQQFLDTCFFVQKKMLNESGDSPDLIPAFDISAGSKPHSVKVVLKKLLF